MLNEKIKPDLTICLHFNAVEWDNCQNLVDDNRLVVFVHGNYLASELKDDEQKLRLFSKLLERSHRAELIVAHARKHTADQGESSQRRIARMRRLWHGWARMTRPRIR